jgi:hypothetical protein
MTWPIKRLAHEAAEPFERIGAQLFRRGALLILGIACLAVSVALFTIVLHGFLRTVTGPEIASLSVGGIYFCAAVTFLVLGRTGTQKVPDPGQGSYGSASTIAPAAGKTPWQSEASNGFSRQVDRIIAPVFTALHEAGLEHERAMLVRRRRSLRKSRRWQA